MGCRKMLMEKGIAVKRNVSEEDMCLVLDACFRTRSLSDTLKQTLLGVFYLEGDVVYKDVKKALKLFNESAKQNEPSALYQLGLMYQDGTGVTADHYKAFDYLLKSARRYQPSAQYHVGLVYSNGYGEDPDRSNAIAWWKHAAKQGHKLAKASLKITAKYGHTDDVNHEENYKLWHIAASDGHAVSQFKIGMMHLEGQFVEKDLKTGIEWISKAAKRNVCAQYVLGLAYHKGYGVEPNFEKALALYRKAAKKGYIHAMIRLGCTSTYEKLLPELKPEREKWRSLARDMERVSPLDVYELDVNPFYDSRGEFVDPGNTPPYKLPTLRQCFDRYLTRGEFWWDLRKLKHTPRSVKCDYYF